MKAKEIITNALKLLGYTSMSGNEQLTARIMSKAIPIINITYSDIWEIEKSEDFEPVAKLDDEIKLSNKAVSVMIYGVCSYIAQSEEDAAQQNIFAVLYNKKRASLSKITTKIDTLPKFF